MTLKQIDPNMIYFEDKSYSVISKVDGVDKILMVKGSLLNKICNVAIKNKK